MYYQNADKAYLDTLGGLSTDGLIIRRLQLIRVLEYVQANNVWKFSGLTDAEYLAKRRVAAIDVALLELASFGRLGDLENAAVTAPPLSTPRPTSMLALSAPVQDVSRADLEVVVCGGSHMTSAEAAREISTTVEFAELDQEGLGVDGAILAVEQSTHQSESTVMH